MVSLNPLNRVNKQFFYQHCATSAAKKNEGTQKSWYARRTADRFASRFVNSLFKRRLVLVDLLPREFFELEEDVFGARSPVELSRHRFAVLQRLVDLLSPVEHGRQFVAVRGRRSRRSDRSVVHRCACELKRTQRARGNEKRENTVLQSRRLEKKTKNRTVCRA